MLFRSKSVAGANVHLALQYAGGAGQIAGQGYFQVIDAAGRSEERRVGKSVDLGGRRIIKKKKKKEKEGVTRRNKAVNEEQIRRTKDKLGRECREGRNRKMSNSR